MVEGASRRLAEIMEDESKERQEQMEKIRKGTPFPDPWIQRPDRTKVVSNLI